MVDKVQAPPEFYRFARIFGADDSEPRTDAHQEIQRALRSLDRDGQLVLRRFLTDFLDSNPAEADLQKLWNSANRFYYIVGKRGRDGVRTFLAMVRDQIK
jgi:hypothetical protein